MVPLFPDPDRPEHRPSRGGRVIEFDPSLLPGRVLDLDAAVGTTTNLANRVLQWDDQSGAAHHLTQADSAHAPLLVQGVFLNSLPGVQFGPGFADQRWMDWNPDFAHTSDETMYAVVKFFVSNADYQIFQLGQATLSRYLGGTGANINRPMIFDGVERALWTSPLADNTVYLIKWATTNLTVGPRQYYTQVNGQNEVMEQVAGAIAVDQFNALGMSHLVVPSQDMVSTVGRLVAYNRKLSVAEDQAWWQWAKARYGA